MPSEGPNQILASALIARFREIANPAYNAPSINPNYTAADDEYDRGTLDERKMITTCVQLHEAHYVDIVVEADVYVEEGYRLLIVQQNVIDALDNYFHWDSMALSRDIRLSDIYTVIDSVDGVDFSKIDKLMVDAAIGQQYYYLTGETDHYEAVIEPGPTVSISPGEHAYFDPALLPAFRPQWWEQDSAVPFPYKFKILMIDEKRYDVQYFRPTSSDGSVGEWVSFGSGILAPDELGAYYWEEDSYVFKDKEQWSIRFRLVEGRSLMSEYDEFVLKTSPELGDIPMDKSELAVATSTNGNFFITAKAPVAVSDSPV